MQACLYLYMLIMGSFYLEMINEGKKMLAEISTQLLNCVQQPSVLSALASSLACWKLLAQRHLEAGSTVGVWKVWCLTS